MWQHPGASSFCLQQSNGITLRFGAWGEKIPEKGWRHMLHYEKYWPLPSNVRFFWISSLFVFIVCLRMFCYMASNKTFQSFFGGVCHIPGYYATRDTLIFPAGFVHVWECWYHVWIHEISISWLFQSCTGLLSAHPSTYMLQELIQRQTPLQ